MNTMNVSQHLFSSVERGYFPKHGRGFQTVAITPDLQGTEDLSRLEDLSFYALSREARTAENKPIKETFFKLPSGKLAIGRTISAGTDSLGREGNYVTHHVIFDEQDFFGNVFAVLNSLHEMDVTADLTPRELPKVALKISDYKFDPEKLNDINAEAVTNFYQLALSNSEKTILLIGEPAPVLIESLFAFLLPEERLRLFFSTHFYESDSLRTNFKIVAVNQLGEMPSSLENYQEIDLSAPKINSAIQPSRHAKWLCECVAAKRWNEIENVNKIIAAVRRDEVPNSLPETAIARGVLRDLTSDESVKLLFGNTDYVREYLIELAECNNEKSIEKLMNISSPSELFGVAADEKIVKDSLQIIQNISRDRAWREWRKRYSSDAYFKLLPEAKWWEIWK
jgi:hypothetical protein